MTSCEAAAEDPRPGAGDLRGRTAVFLHAHPDDEAIFTAAVMRRLADRGARVVLVTATPGDEGRPLRPLPPGESVARRRVRELETACAELGVARLELLPYRDSGMPGAAANEHRRAFARHRAGRAGVRLRDLLVAERAEALVHYDDAGIYGHPDHLAVARLGSWVASRLPVVAYEATVDRDHVGRGPRHLVEGSRPRHELARIGRSAADVTTRLCATDDEVSVKRRAMAAHASQIPADVLTDDGFGRVYGHEWFVRRGPRGLLDDVCATTEPCAPTAVDVSAGRGAPSSLRPHREGTAPCTVRP